MMEYILKDKIEIELEDKTTLTIEKLEFPEILRAKHIRVMKDDSFSGKPLNPCKQLPLISILTGVNEDYLDELSFVDLGRICEVITGLMGEREESNEDSKD
jgi:hypothetical protein